MIFWLKIDNRDLNYISYICRNTIGLWLSTCIVVVKMWRHVILSANSLYIAGPYISVEPFESLYFWPNNELVEVWLLSICVHFSSLLINVFCMGSWRGMVHPFPLRIVSDLCHFNSFSLPMYSFEGSFYLDLVKNWIVKLQASWDLCQASNRWSLVHTICSKRTWKIYMHFYFSFVQMYVNFHVFWNYICILILK
jgi:hypothetical protein